jgi:hypothetical protein
MTLQQIVDKLGLKPLSAISKLSEEVRGGYVSDLLSDVMGNAKAGDLWVTLQTHQNIVAVASLKEIAGIILIGGREPEKQTLAKAEAENIPLLLSNHPAFEVVGRLYQMGIPGRI